MDNKKIPTWLGIAILIIFTFTIGIFLKNWEEKYQLRYSDIPVIHSSNTKNDNPPSPESVSPSQTDKQPVDLEDIQRQLESLNSEDGSVTYTAIDAKENNLESGNYAIQEDLLMNRLHDFPNLSSPYYIKYTNKKLGFSFVYSGNPKTYIKEVDSGKLQYIGYDTESDKYYPDSQNYIEIYRKKDSKSLKEAAEDLIVKNGADLKKCKFNNYHDKYKNGETIVVDYYKPYEYNKNKCLESEIDKGPMCDYRLRSEHDKIASKNCSAFEEGGYYNYFIYQPENSTNKFVFIRHISGMDAPHWNVHTIKLFD